MTVHLKHGGSTAHRTINCAAWQKLSEDVPKTDDSNPAADQGTMLHDAMEIIYKPESETTPEHLLETHHQYNGIIMTEELMNGKLYPAMEALDDLIEEYDIVEWKVEPFVTIDDDIGGSIDFLGISRDRKTVIDVDYKFGYVGVPAPENDQLQFYALAAATDEATRDWFDAAGKIVLAIIQPNDDGPVTDIWEIDMDQIDEFETTYLAAVEKSDAGDGVPTAGDWCKYCPAHAVCPAKTGAALQASRVTEITADKLAEYLPLADEVVAWAKEVQKMAHEQLELGTPIKGYKLVQKRASRVWNDKPAVEDKVRKAKKILIEEGFTLELKSPPQLEKVCKTKKINFDKTYGSFVSAVSFGTTLAKEDDKRPAALPLAGLEQLNALND